MKQDSAHRTAETLAGIELFHDLPPEAVQDLSKHCHWRRYGARKLIFSCQDERRDVYFIARGTVRVIYYSACGREVSFRDLSAGEMFGELSAIDAQPRSASVMAITDSVIGVMPPRLFWEMLEHHQEVTAVILQRLVKLVRALSERVVEFSTLAVRNRIHAELLRMARANAPTGVTAVIYPVPTHVEIASRVGTCREAVTRELNGLVRTGIIAKRGGTLVVQSIPDLARMVQVLQSGGDHERHVDLAAPKANGSKRP